MERAQKMFPAFLLLVLLLASSEMGQQQQRQVCARFQARTSRGSALSAATARPSAVAKASWTANATGSVAGASAPPPADQYIKQYIYTPTELYTPIYYKHGFFSLFMYE